MSKLSPRPCCEKNNFCLTSIFIDDPKFAQNAPVYSCFYYPCPDSLYVYPTCPPCKEVLPYQGEMFISPRRSDDRTGVESQIIPLGPEHTNPKSKIPNFFALCPLLFPNPQSKILSASCSALRVFLDHSPDFRINFIRFHLRSDIWKFGLSPFC